MRKINKYFILLFLCLISIFFAKCILNKKTWEVVYSHNHLGLPLHGKKQDLISAIKDGSNIRISWSLVDSTRNKHKSIEHFSEVKLITVLNQNEVFAQLPGFMAQRPFFNDSLRVNLRPITSTWILSTNGLISSFNDSEVNEDEDSFTNSEPIGFSLTWYVKK